MKLAFLLVTTLAACSATDDRPETLAFITESILQPNCGTAECHSAMKKQSLDVFDSVAGAQSSIQNNGLIACAGPNSTTLDPCDLGGKTYLITVLTTTDVEGDRMPLDQPLANKDIFFIEQWITDGAEGYTPNAGAN
jgi:hypothetical protein